MTANTPTLFVTASDTDVGKTLTARALIGALRVRDSVQSLAQLAKGDPDASVRNAACHALGQLRDGAARPVLEDIAKTDSDGLVRDQAQIALRRL